MSPSTAKPELVGILPDKDSFEKAVEGLLQAGFKRQDLSVLASHNSLDAAQTEGDALRDKLVGLVGELKYEGPLVAAGLIALAAGPVGAALAGVVAAGVGAAALKEFLDEVTALPDSKEFERAIEAGSLILWVAAETDERQAQARSVLEVCGADNLHLAERKNG